MKKTILTIAALGLTFAGMAQDKFVSSALTALSQKSYDEAKADIDKAMASPETKDKPKTLYAKVQIYYELLRQEKYKNLGLYKEASNSLIKLVELKPEFEKELINTYLMSFATMYYNDGVRAYGNDKNKAEAQEDMKALMKIHEVGGGKRFEKSEHGKKFDTLLANANLTLARIAYDDHDSLESIKVLTNVVHNPITKSKDNYYVLLESYATFNTANNNKMGAEELAALKEAREAFPDDANIRNMENNCFNRTGKTKELVTKLEETVAAEPNNADAIANLAILYQSLARPKDGAIPANGAELLAKSETNFKRALKLAPENSNINFGAASLYFNQAFDFNEQMAKIEGNSDDDLKKVDALKLKRDDMFEKALPYMEKTCEIFSAKEANLRGNDAETYHAAMISLKQIYVVQNKMDKATDLGKKIKAFETRK